MRVRIARDDGGDGSNHSAVEERRIRGPHVGLVRPVKGCGLCGGLDVNIAHLGYVIHLADLRICIGGDGR